MLDFVFWLLVFATVAWLGVVIWILFLAPADSEEDSDSEKRDHQDVQE